MYNSNVLKIIKNFTKFELRELGKFVQSPYFNQREDVVNLYNYIAQNLGNTPKLFEKDKVFAHLYPKKSYDDAALRFTMHSLLKVIKQYLTQKEWESNAVEGQLLLAKAMRKRGFDDYFEKEIEACKDINNQHTNRNALFHYNNYQLEIENLEYITLTRRKGDMPFQEAFNSLTYFFVSELLHYSCIAYSYKNISQRNYKIHLLEDALNWVEQNVSLLKNSENTEGVAIAIYYYAYKALSTNEIEYFNELKKLLYANWMLFPENEARVLYFQAINFCIKRINAHEVSFLHEYFDIMQSGLINKRLFENGVLSKFTYKNAVTAALRLEKFEWAKQFLDDYKIYLHPKDRESAYNFNLATYYYRLNDFDNALKLLQLSDFGDVQTNLAARSIQMRIYYETKENEALLSLMDSSQAYILRQKDIGYLKDNYMNLIKFVRRMLKIDMSNKVEKTKILEDVHNTKNVVEREWLLEKLK